MANDERMLYQNNKVGYLLVIAFIALNTVYTFFILNVMPKDSGIGSFVMLTIGLLLLGFLMAIKVRIYSIIWCYITIITGAFQSSRVLFTVNNLEGITAVSMNIMVVVSGIICIAGGIVSLGLSKTRQKLK